MHHHFGTVRSLVHGPPSRTVFEDVCHIVADQLSTLQEDAQQALLHYVHLALLTWPEHTIAPDRSWFLPVIQGQRDRRLLLCAQPPRALRLFDSTMLGSDTPSALLNLLRYDGYGWQHADQQSALKSSQFRWLLTLCSELITATMCLQQEQHPMVLRWSVVEGDMRPDHALTAHFDSSNIQATVVERRHAGDALTALNKMLLTWHQGEHDPVEALHARGRELDAAMLEIWSPFVDAHLRGAEVEHLVHVSAQYSCGAKGHWLGLVTRDRTFWIEQRHAL